MGEGSRARQATSLSDNTDTCKRAPLYTTGQFLTDRYRSAPDASELTPRQQPTLPPPPPDTTGLLPLSAVAAPLRGPDAAAVHRKDSTTQNWVFPSFFFFLARVIPLPSSSMVDSKIRPGPEPDSSDGEKPTDTTLSSSDDEQVSPIPDPPAKGETKQRLLGLWNWIPPPARYDVENPPKFTLWLNILFAFVRLPLFCEHSRPLMLTWTPGIMLHRVQLVLQPGGAQSDCRDV